MGRSSTRSRRSGGSFWDEPYRVPGHRRFAGVALIPIVVLAMGLNIPSDPTWLWVLPGLSTVLFIVFMVRADRARTRRQATWGTLGQIVFGLGSLALLFVPISLG